jgi:hypothetical protein
MGGKRDGRRKIRTKRNEKKKLRKMKPKNIYYHTKNPLHRFCLSW